MTETDFQILQRKVRAKKKAAKDKILQEYETEIQELKQNKTELKAEIWRRQNENMLADTISTFKREERKRIEQNLQVQREFFIARAKSIGLTKAQIDEIFTITSESNDKRIFL